MDQHHCIEHGSGKQKDEPKDSEEMDICLICLAGNKPLVWHNICGICYTGVHNYFLNILNIDTIKFLKLKKDILENFNFYEVLFKENKNFEHFRKIIFYENKNLSFDKVFNFKNENFNLFNFKSTEGAQPGAGKSNSLVGSTDNGNSLKSGGTTYTQKEVAEDFVKICNTENPAEGSTPAGKVKLDLGGSAIEVRGDLEDPSYLLDMDKDEEKNIYYKYNEEIVGGKAGASGYKNEVNGAVDGTSYPNTETLAKQGQKIEEVEIVFEEKIEDEVIDEEDPTEGRSIPVGTTVDLDMDDDEDSEMVDEYDEVEEEAGASGKKEEKVPAADSRAVEPTGAPGGTTKSLADEGKIKWAPEDRVREEGNPEEEVSRDEKEEEEKGTVADDRSQKEKNMDRELEVEDENSMEEEEDMMIRKLNEEIERWKKIKERLKKEKKVSEEKIDKKIELEMDDDSEEKVDKIIELEIDEKVKCYDLENKNLDKLILDEKGKVKAKKFYGKVLRRKFKNNARKFICKNFSVDGRKIFTLENF